MCCCRGRGPRMKLRRTPSPPSWRGSRPTLSCTGRTSCCGPSQRCLLSASIPASCTPCCQVTALCTFVTPHVSPPPSLSHCPPDHEMPPLRLLSGTDLTCMQLALICSMHFARHLPQIIHSICCLQSVWLNGSQIVCLNVHKGVCGCRCSHNGQA